jgi:hypothetical protein
LKLTNPFSIESTVKVNSILLPAGLVIIYKVWLGAGARGPERIKLVITSGQFVAWIFHQLPEAGPL